MWEFRLDPSSWSALSGKLHAFVCAPAAALDDVFEALPDAESHCGASNVAREVLGLRAVSSESHVVLETARHNDGWTLP